MSFYFFFSSQLELVPNLSGLECSTPVYWQLDSEQEGRYIYIYIYSCLVFRKAKVWGKASSCYPCCCLRSKIRLCRNDGFFSKVRYQQCDHCSPSEENKPHSGLRLKWKTILRSRCIKWCYLSFWNCSRLFRKQDRRETLMWFLVSLSTLCITMYHDKLQWVNHESYDRSV